MKHICVDARMVNNSGIGVYIRHFVTVLLANDAFKVTLLGREIELKKYFNEHSYYHIEADYPIYSITEQINLPKSIPVCDVFWAPHYNIPLLPIRARKTLVTIPDVFHVAFYKTLSLSQKIYAKILTNAAARKPNHIITISNYSKQEIIRFTGIRADKIDVIYLGLDSDFFRLIDAPNTRLRVRNQYNIPEKYILFVGNVKPNKNLKALVSAFSMLLDRLPDYKLLIVGKKEGFINGDKELFDGIANDPKLDNRVAFTGYVELEDLPVLYSMASVFAFPSLYEGFGFPPLEAMACGCPVVASNRASIPEICGDAATYVNPDMTDEFADAIYRVLNNDELRTSLISKGYNQVKQYSWDKAGQSFLQTLNSLLV